jgi:hypothetical protein
VWNGKDRKNVWDMQGEAPPFLYFEVILEGKLTVKDIDKITFRKQGNGAF